MKNHLDKVDDLNQDYDDDKLMFFGVFCLYEVST